jgi:uncharacterized protein
MQENIETIEQKKGKHYAVKGASNADFAIKDVDTVGRVVTGFFGTFNYFDSDSDVLLKGSTKKSIQERGPNSKAVAKIKHALFHDLTRLVGKIITLEERDVNGLSGIYFETKMADTTEGNDALKNYLEKIYDNHSIGFQYLDVEMVDRDAKGWDKAKQNLINPEEAEKQGYMFLVKDIKLYEGSTVAFGANQLTPFLGVKSGNKESLKLALYSKTAQLRKALTSGTQSDEMMQTFELQVLQMNQMISELVNEIPFGNTSARQVEQKNEVVNSGIDYKFLINKF